MRSTIENRYTSMILGGIALAACLVPSNAFTTSPTFQLTSCQGHCVTSKSLLKVSKSRLRDREETTTNISHNNDNIPFFDRMPFRQGATELPQHFSAAKYPVTINQDDESRSSEESPLSLDENPTLALGVGAIALVTITGALLYSSMDHHPNLSDLIPWFQQLVAHPKETLEAGVDAVQAMGPAGAWVFGLIYCVAEILAVPATPLTLSAGYLFGVVQGTAIVLLAATCAASVAFVIGKTFLRTWVEETLADNPKFAKLDKAIGKEGFKLLLLVRLSPIFPFALSNYLYGASSIDFASYFWGTLLGFAPGTVAYVYTGMVGKALTLGGGDSTEPWYVYAGGFALLAGFLKLASDVASGIVEAIDQEDGDQ